ncbi:RidA family protein [Actinokineospora sp.]|uniref:RidA family protein n=1 Tax=Actinokineospora sp. TaxID=1872133 RepID=UPI004037E108
MPITRMNPAGLSPPPGNCHVTVATGGRLVHVSGQVGLDETGNVVGPDHRSQAERAFRNLLIALDAAGATIDDVAKVTFYLVDNGPEALAALFEAAAAVHGEELPISAVTLIGVASLGDPALKVEIEATAVLP